MPGATSYDIYRSTAPGGEGATPYITGVTTATFTDMGLTDGTKYYYKVRADNIVGPGPVSVESSASTVTAQTQTFIRHAFQDFLYRLPTAAELAGWGTAIQANSVTTSQFIQTVTTSQEFRIDAAVQIYQGLIGSAPSAQSVASLVNQFNTGLTETQVMNNLLGTSYFTAYANSLPGATSDQSANFVRRVYTVLLGRTANAAEVAYWEGQVNTSNRWMVAHQFLTSVNPGESFRYDFISAVFSQTALPAPAFVRTSAVPNLLHRTSAPTFSDVSFLINSSLDLLAVEQAVAERTEYFNRP